MKRKIRCSNGMGIQVSPASDLAMEELVHPHIPRHLTPLRLIPIMMRSMKRAEMKTKTTSEASQRPPQHLFGA